MHPLLHITVKSSDVRLEDVAGNKVDCLLSYDRFLLPYLITFLQESDDSQQRPNRLKRVPSMLLAAFLSFPSFLAQRYAGMPL